MHQNVPLFLDSLNASYLGRRIELYSVSEEQFTIGIIAEAHQGTQVRVRFDQKVCLVHFDQDEQPTIDLKECWFKLWFDNELPTNPQALLHREVEVAMPEWNLISADPNVSVYFPANITICFTYISHFCHFRALQND